jgi:hypothetical protein
MMPSISCGLFASLCGHIERMMSRVNIASTPFPRGHRELAAGAGMRVDNHTKAEGVSPVIRIAGRIK